MMFTIKYEDIVIFICLKVKQTKLNSKNNNCTYSYTKL